LITPTVEPEFMALTAGLEVTTAGSLAAGTGTGRMRWLMKVVQEECRYDMG
jgi:hypothetical protein